MKRISTFLLAVVVFGGFTASHVMALPQFKKAFGEKYTDKEQDEAFFTIVRKAGCNVCHVKGEEKEIQNAYGKELNKLVEGAAKARLDAAKEAGNKDEVEAQLLKEIDGAFGKVALMKNEAGETYGERLKSGQLPVPLPTSESETTSE